MVSSATDVLLLEDDANLGFVLQEQLESLGYTVTLRTNGQDGLTETDKGSFALCLVDIMMPKKDGFTFARQLRANGDQTPIIFLTAKSLKEDRIEGFRIGGDDYVTKPFSMEELTLRISAVLKRTRGAAREKGGDRLIRIGSSVLDTVDQTLSRGKRSRKLTIKETGVIALLAAKKNEIVGRKDLLTAVWGEDSIYTSRSLDVFVSRLRKYFKGEPGVEIINAHGVGYRLVDKKRVGIQGMGTPRATKDRKEPPGV